MPQRIVLARFAPSPQFAARPEFCPGYQRVNDAQPRGASKLENPQLDIDRKKIYL
jgi:hypothetical protein